ncbi:nucleotidyltransferase domain-containing protein [Photobacterium profundum]|uniref:nucleotidyltransferase domain-containing protein n=1 Tax=Photobacterium profundum TaxID=74109 RepID=UPI003D0F9D01
MEIECQGDMDLDNGLDEHGYVLNRCSPQNIQREFQPLIVETINLLVSTFSNQIHSIYLYGSIARGEAVLYKSDLDISVIFHSPLVYAQQLQLEQLASIICRDFPIISKVDFDLGHVDEVMDSVAVVFGGTIYQYSSENIGQVFKFLVLLIVISIVC